MYNGKAPSYGPAFGDFIGVAQLPVAESKSMNNVHRAATLRERLR